MVVDEAGVAFEVESDSVGKPDVESETGPEGRRDAAAIPKIVLCRELGLESVSLIVAESVVGTDTTKDVRIDGTVKLVTGEERCKVSHEVDSTLNKVVLVDLSATGVDSTLALPTIDIQPGCEHR